MVPGNKCQGDTEGEEGQTPEPIEAQAHRHATPPLRLCASA